MQSTVSSSQSKLTYSESLAKTFYQHAHADIRVDQLNGMIYDLFISLVLWHALDLVLDKPINVQVFGASSTSLRVTWDTADTSIQSSSASSSSSPPVAAAAAAAPPATYYKVLLHDVNDLADVEMNVTVGLQQAIITDLCQFCEYKVRVVAYNVDGASHSSEEVTGRTVSDGKFCFSSQPLLTETTVEFYLYPTVSTALVHSVKPKLTE